jgi:hypothetical protein
LKHEKITKITKPRNQQPEQQTIEAWIRVITKLPNSEQSYKGKVKTHKYINRQISQQPENCENRNDPDLVQAFQKKEETERRKQNKQKSKLR